MSNTVNNLSKEMPKHTFKRGCFLLSTKTPKPSEYWIDLYGLSHLFNATNEAKHFQRFLSDMIERIILHQLENVKINSVIVSRWTRCTEDLFSETLLNICFELLGTKLSDKNIKLYELFSAGGNNEEYYLNRVETLNAESSLPQDRIKAVAFLALDIHTWLIDSLLKCCKEVEVYSVISVLGRCKTYPRIKQRKHENKDSEFLLYPLFNATDYNPLNHTGGFSFLLDDDDSNSSQFPEKLYRKLFVSGRDCDTNRRYIPSP